MAEALLYRSVGDVTDVGHDVGVEIVDCRDHALGPLLAIDRPEVSVGDRDYPKFVHPRTKAGDGDVDLLDPWQSHGFPVAPDQQKGRDDQCGNGDDSRSKRVIHAADEQSEPQNFAEQGPHEHDPDDSEEGVADQANWIAVGVSVAEHHARRQGDQEGGKQNGAENCHRRRPVRPDEQAPPWVHEQQSQDRRDNRGYGNDPQRSAARNSSDVGRLGCSHPVQSKGPLVY